ncbi:hypothetical protein [Segetibacter aerophilus]|nr:hypothetical protein [Segetibacter aerophilus]
MKVLLCIAAFFSTVLFFACTKNYIVDDSINSAIVGKWFLVETLADPGDGSGRWTPVSDPNRYYMKFNSDGSLENNTPGILANLRRYKTPNDSSINFVYPDGASFSLRYKIEGNSLTLSGGCIEACGSKFIRRPL